MEVLTEEIMKCVKCNIVIPPKRLEILPGTKTCVNCSTTGAYSGRPVLHGKGDHTFVELAIMTPEQAKRIEELENPKDKKKKMEWNGKDDDSHIDDNQSKPKKPEDIQDN